MVDEDHIASLFGDHQDGDHRVGCDHGLENIVLVSDISH